MNQKSKEVKHNVCEAINMLYGYKDKDKRKGFFDEHGVPRDKFVGSFIELCKLRYGVLGLDIATEAFAHYGRSAMKKSFFKATKQYKICPRKEAKGVVNIGHIVETKSKEEFSVSLSTRTCDFGDEIYNFVLNKRKII